MKFTAATFRRRIEEMLAVENGNIAGPQRRVEVLSGWTAERVSEFLRRALDTEGARAMERVVVIGAGGHAKVVLDILEEDGNFEIVGCTSKSPQAPGLRAAILGDDSVLPELQTSGVRNAFVALGDNRARREIMLHLEQTGFRLVNAISPHAIISPRARLGCGVAVMPGAVINAGAEIGSGTIVNTGATIDHDCRIGICAHVAPGVSLAGCVTVEEGAFLGVGSRAIPGVRVGAWSVVGAGAVVIRDLPSSVTAVGVPAAIVSRSR